MKEEGSIENVIDRVQKDNDDPKKKKKYHIPETFYFKESRELFKNPDVDDDLKKIEQSLKWRQPDEEALKEFLVKQKGFSETRVENGINKLKKCQGKSN